MTSLGDVAVLSSVLAEEVVAGLSAKPKRLPPKLFYDAEGSRLFEEITETPEYYPTRTERGIFLEFASQMAVQAGGGLTLVELGAGSATKTRMLIAALLRRQLHLDFYPVDVSPGALSGAVTGLNGDFPNLRVEPILADYSRDLPQLKQLPGRKLVLFLGSTIGNFEPGEARDFLARLREALSPRDALLAGFDMRKDAAILRAAYNDRQQVTARFNKNVLARINRELGGRFNLDAFAHLAIWNPRKSRVEMYLESRAEQEVWVEDIQRTFRFARGERIHTENSYKFSSASMSTLLRRAGWRIERTWTDSQGWFSDTLAKL